MNSCFDYRTITQSKTKIVFTHQKGRFLKLCPGTPEHICCNYLVIQDILNCPHDCSYCYLQTYLNKPQITVYTNMHDLVRDLEWFFAQNQNRHFRIGTGEFSDSLALDDKTKHAKPLIELFAQQSNHLLELKTKSDKVNHLFNLAHNGKTVIAWSLNPQKLIPIDEKGAVSLERRLKAARKCVEAGYKVGFHFDPLIDIPDFEKEYGGVVELIFKYVKPGDIAWISLGALRFQPQLKDIIEERFPKSRITLGEFVLGEDKKMRYFKPIRVNMFKTVYNLLRRYSKDIFIYLCMESPEIWREVRVRNKQKSPYQKYFRFHLTTLKSPC